MIPARAVSGVVVPFCVATALLVVRAAEPPSSPTVLPDLVVSAEADPGSLESGRSGLPWSSWDVPGFRGLGQGGGWGQTDGSMRAGAFSEVGFSVAGLSLRNPQTEHFNTELPLHPALFAVPVAVVGVEQARLATGHAVGGIALDFAPVREGVDLRLSTGERDTRGGSLRWGHHLPTPAAAGIQAFAAADRMGGFDYADNDSERLAGGLHLQRWTDRDRFDAVLGYQQKEFGARGFYGVSPTLDSRERLDDGLALASYARTGSDVSWRAVVLTRRTKDEYRLSESAPNRYRNTHVSRTHAASLDGAFTLSRPVRLQWRAFLEDERVDSHGVYLGAPTNGLGVHDRQHLALRLLPVLTHDSWTFTAGGQASAFTTAEPEWLAICEIRNTVSEGHAVHVGYSETVRQPSFTELDYNSPSSLGTAGLQNQRTGEAEAGWAARWNDSLTSHLTVFRRYTQHAVDWMQTASGARWVATDIGGLLTHGVEATATWQISPSLTTAVTGQWVHKDSDEPHYASRYRLDYPLQHCGIDLGWSPVERLRLRFRQEFVHQTENPVRTESRNGFPASLSLAWQPPATTHTLLELRCDNLWGDDFQVYPGQRAARRHVLAGMHVRW